MPRCFGRSTKGRFWTATVLLSQIAFHLNPDIYLRLTPPVSRKMAKDDADIVVPTIKDAVLLAVEDEVATSKTSHLRISRVRNVEVSTKSVVFFSE